MALWGNSSSKKNQNFTLANGIFPDSTIKLKKQKTLNIEGHTLIL